MILADGMNDRDLCPFIGGQDKDCYCLEMTSLKVINVIKFCGDRYTLCLIYQKKIKEKNNRSR